MRVSLRWIGEYTDLPDISLAELGKRLTQAGLEVEAILPLAVEGVFVGQVLTVEPHPSADQLRICQVQVGEEVFTSVCGAPNVAPGLRVPYALPGARLPGDATVHTAQIRGVRSEGMILSREELGLEEKSRGIWELPQDVPQGADLATLLELPDALLSLKIASNRPDLLGIYGLAREFSALFGGKLRELDLEFPEEGPPVESLITVEVESGEDCPRYVARVIRNLRPRPAPLAVTARLLKCGMRPISLVVDLTNYVMLELGHPLHAFDYAKLMGRRIVVRRARPGENLRTLDGLERALSPEVLVIADEKRPVAIAGIMGGEDTEVGTNTEEILLEAAAFSPARIRRGARLLGLRTEASLRFERGLSPAGVDIASRRLCALLSHFQGGQVASGAVDLYLQPQPRRTILLRKARIPEFLGAAVPEELTISGLSRQGLKLLDRGPFWEVEVPPFRSDLWREEDLLEEVARIYGYERIPAVAPLALPRVGRKDPEGEFADRVRKICASLGLYEAYTIPLVPKKEAEILLRNPMAQGQEGLRKDLLPGLLQALVTNLSAQVPGVALFEVGKVFFLRGGQAGEEYRVGLLLAGRPPIPLAGKTVYGPGELKGLVEALLAALHVEGVGLGPYEDDRFHPFCRAALLLNGEPLGVLGEVNSALLDLPREMRVLFAELRLPVLFAGARAVEYRPLPKFPASKRDLSLLVPEEIPEERVRALILAEPLVESVFLYDRYQGAGIPPGRVSLTYELVFRHPDRTLSAEEVEAAVQRILAGLSTLGVQLRT